MPTNYQFQSLLYRTRTDMLRAIAEAWITGGEDIATVDVAARCADQSNDEIAAECIRAWALDEPTLDEPAHMEQCDYSAEDLAEAIGELRAEHARAFTCYGPVRGQCGQRHATIEDARVCIRADHAGCIEQGGYSDRVACGIDADGYLIDANGDFVRGPDGAGIEADKPAQAQAEHAPGAAAILAAILERLEPGTLPSRRYNRLVRIGTVEVLELRDHNSGSDPDPDSKPRHQFTATTDGTIWCRVLPPVTFGDSWADTGAPRWEPVAYLDGIIAEAAPLLQRAPLLRMRRQAMQDGQGCEFYRVQGEDMDVGDAARVELACGPVTGAWWEVPLPPCPDCGGAVAWAEAGFVPGTRECQGCGSLFTVLPDHEGKA